MRTTEKHKNETNRDGWQSKKKKEKIRQSYTISTAELYKGHLLFCQESFKKKKAKFKIKYTM